MAVMAMTKRGKFTILGVLLVIVMILIAINLVKAKVQGNGASLAGVPAQGVAAIPDYHLIPVLDTQSAGIRQVYLNTSTTPALFFSTNSSQFRKDIKIIQDKVSKINSPHKPLVLVSTFLKTTEQLKAVEDAKTFQQKFSVTLPVTVQVGPPTEFVMQTLSLVYSDDKGTHILTDENKILDALNAVLALPNPPETPPQPPEK